MSPANAAGRFTWLQPIKIYSNPNRLNVTKGDIRRRLKQPQSPEAFTANKIDKARTKSIETQIRRSGGRRSEGARILDGGGFVSQEVCEFEVYFLGFSFF